MWVEFRCIRNRKRGRWLEANETGPFSFSSDRWRVWRTEVGWTIVVVDYFIGCVREQQCEEKLLLRKEKKRRLRLIYKEVNICKRV